ncbi:GTPase involved in ribosome 50S subunit assembly [Weissella viridescens]|jgi:GTP-binding protein|uniref:Probable GTP-binding protein EngB n=1 Tax=Weissella viridescens TaxID=1629 RepID=A0A0R2GYB5_WEIVI|nr:ribosome biogenesis GTP-binding protein YihA/YsxC [Weissella viridescens]KRN45696.1 ribosome biogenesis GTP-binding protein YsxC [Weissella viridescens]MBX4173492.1 ribosome biogenesis GTP-binding protein YihA/YsxC [Weissella viridescens]MCB6840893.1 ribosome biogenesis GTP-binding protein YihA/YsxC [Weissella viridescens]MCB6847626.1 ribosome biogenesis GTP-binding protein YihA/YsxC [Weissella viridescens]WJI91798.1 ribosome biogenesis GTP-binding protein YihA/YsxC [Weissella viridescens]
MEVHNVALTISAVRPEQYPKDGLPEIAFVGRSNVGKSSLTNTLINRKAFARTSSQPGKTQTLNFYRVEDEVYFVDVPGYGYAKVSRKEREKWGVMIETYLSQRQELKGVISLVDARHEPSEEDINMYNWLLYYEIPVLVVATKADKIARGKWNKAESVIKKALDFDPTVSDFQMFSSETKYGKEQVWDWIEAHMG